MTGHSSAKSSTIRRSVLISEDERQTIIYALSLVAEDERNTAELRQAAFDMRARLLP